MLMPTQVHRFLIQDPVDAVNRDLGNLVDRFLNGNDGKTSAVYAADVREDADHFYVEAELPGYRKEQIDITLEKNVLTITAEKKVETSADAAATAPVAQPAEWLLRERQTASFHRAFKLPPSVSEGKVDAKLVDGVLFITLNKREESKPRKIPVT